MLVPTLRRCLVALSVAGAAGAIACTRIHASRPDALLVVTLDTTRADRLPAYGDTTTSAPALDRLAAGGVVFDRAESVAPLTLTAHTSLFTGLYPPNHGVRDNADRPLEPGHRTLAETLRGAGFRTAAFVGSMVLGPDRGLSRGFEAYRDGRSPGLPPPRRRPANEVVDDALGWLDAERPSRFFVWVHLYDPHGPQTLPDDYRERYAGDLYAGAISFMDAQIARLLDRLDLDRTAVIVVGDHGESLGDHGELEHGIFLYEAALHVPLIVHAPHVQPHRVSGLVSLVDIVPTVLGLMDLPAPATDGVSLLPALAGRGAIPERSLYAESMYARRFGWSPPRMLRDGRFKLIDLPRPELYDLDTDPFESHDLAAERPSLVRGMRLELDRMAGSARHDIAPGKPATVAALASLGYVSGTPASHSVDGLDPKDFIERYNETTRRRARR